MSPTVRDVRHGAVFITGDVQLPKALLDAHRDGNLLFFIGAGASVASPSDLPLFNELARYLAELAGATPPMSMQFSITSLVHFRRTLTRTSTPASA